MSLSKADLWFGVCSVSMGAMSHTFTHLRRTNPLSPLHEPLHWRAKRDPRAKMLSLQSFLRKGVSVAYVGRNQNLKDLKVSLAMLGAFET